MPAATHSLTEIQRDALREAANIGAGHAATALAELTGLTIRMAVPTVGLHPLARACDIAGDAEAPAAAVFVQVAGDARGCALVLLDLPGASLLASLLLGGRAGELDTLAASALCEAGNILVSSFLSAIADHAGMRLAAAPPALAVDTGAAIVGSALAATGHLVADLVLAIDARFKAGGRPLSGRFLFLPEAGCLPALLCRLGVAG